MQEWFGTNVTTFKENAYRETRAQTGASSAMLGSGVGTAVGLVTSGAINRAIDTQKAKKEADKAKKAKEEADSQTEETTVSLSKKQLDCESAGGQWKNGICKKAKQTSEMREREECAKQSGKIWDGTACVNGKTEDGNAVDAARYETEDDRPVSDEDYEAALKQYESQQKAK